MSSDVQSNHITANCTEITLGDTKLLFSYDTLVAATAPNGTKYRHVSRFSRTSEKHLTLAGYANATPIDGESLEAYAFKAQA